MDFLHRSLRTKAAFELNSRRGLEDFKRNPTRARGGLGVRVMNLTFLLVPGWQLIHPPGYLIGCHAALYLSAQLVTAALCVISPGEELGLRYRRYQQHCQESWQLMTMVWIVNAVLMALRCRSAYTKHWRRWILTEGVIRVWNELPGEVVEAGTITTFKRHLDGYVRKKGLAGWGQMLANGTRLIMGYLVSQGNLYRRAHFHAG
ncbi:ankyrin repeat domain-containing protein 39 isoform X3 [Stegostoma tigrinum]|uniref:ankyrin repeat domain-containing protein 39 isoform X3 n=1 Tax=Stegostoma tigrinum TaxID=3053191 RepID=UPI00202B1700|nr:ankyrin repeat domain-containing protein 39 isoform X3 [Stegostoma tigrinum]